MNTLFGSRLRTDVLVTVAQLGETYPAELARVLERKPIEIRRVLASLERSGALVTRLLGKTRIVTLNPRFFAAAELYELLLRLGEVSSDARRDLRRRPRAISKTS